MKKLLLLPFLLIAFCAFSQGLKTNANFIKTKYPTEYSQTIRKHAVEKWSTNHEMVVYRINNQADALFKLVNNFKTENTTIAYEAIKKWSIDGYESSNMQKFKSIKTFSVDNLIKLHCDWEMIIYQYNNQVNAKSAY